MYLANVIIGILQYLSSKYLKHIFVYIDILVFFFYKNVKFDCLISGIALEFSPNYVIIRGWCIGDFLFICVHHFVHLSSMCLNLMCPI